MVRLITLGFGLKISSYYIAQFERKMSFSFNPGIFACPVQSLKTAQLALADFDIHLIEDISDLSLRDSEILCNLKAHRAGNFPVL